MIDFVLKWVFIGAVTFAIGVVVIIFGYVLPYDISLEVEYAIRTGERTYGTTSYEEKGGSVYFVDAYSGKYIKIRDCYVVEKMK